MIFKLVLFPAGPTFNGEEIWNGCTMLGFQPLTASFTSQVWCPTAPSKQHLRRIRELANTSERREPRLNRELRRSTCGSVAAWS